MNSITYANRSQSIKWEQDNFRCVDNGQGRNVFLDLETGITYTTAYAIAVRADIECRTVYREVVKLEGTDKISPKILEITVHGEFQVLSLISSDDAITIYESLAEKNNKVTAPKAQKAIIEYARAGATVEGYLDVAPELLAIAATKRVTDVNAATAVKEAATSHVDALGRKTEPTSALDWAKNFIVTEEARLQLEADNKVLEAEKEALEATIETNKEKVAHFDTAIVKEGVDFAKYAQSIADHRPEGAAKGRNTLFKFLEGKKVFKANFGDGRVPYQTYIDRGYFVVKETIKPKYGTTYSTLITEKGKLWLTTKLYEWSYLVKDVA